MATNNPAFVADEPGMLNGRDQQKNDIITARKDIVDDEGKPLLCGYGSCAPKWLQALHNPKLLTSFLSLCVIIQGMMLNGFVPVSITSLEKRFNLNSTQSGLFYSTYEIAVVLALIPVCHWGNKGHKGRWIGFGMLVLAVGAFIIASPQFIAGSYDGGQSVSDVCLKDGKEVSCSARGSSLHNYLFILMLGQLLVGFGASPLYTLVISYIDESVSQRASPIYLAIYYGAATIGPALGFVIGGILLNIWGDVGKSDWHDLGISGTDDPRWYGAWWMAFILTGVCALFCALPVLGYAHELPGGILVPMAFLGTITGGILLRVFRMQCGGAIRLCLIFNIICVAFNFIFLTQCPDVPFAGVSTPYANRSVMEESNLNSGCNQNCHCVERYEPVCNKQLYMAYYSPCYAGCAIQNGTELWSDCACVKSLAESRGMNQSSFDEHVESGLCETSCGGMIFFMIFFSLFVLVIFCSAIPMQQAVLRVVPFQQRTMSLGYGWLFIRIFGSIPSGILLGMAIDSTCILWKTDCGVKQACLRYSSQDLSHVMFGFGIGMKIFIVCCLAIAYWFYRPPTDLTDGSAQVEPRMNSEDNKAQIISDKDDTLDLYL